MNSNVENIKKKLGLIGEILVNNNKACATYESSSITFNLTLSSVEIYQDRETLVLTADNNAEININIDDIVDVIIEDDSVQIEIDGEIYLFITTF